MALIRLPLINGSFRKKGARPSSFFTGSITRHIRIFVSGSNVNSQKDALPNLNKGSLIHNRKVLNACWQHSTLSEDNSHPGGTAKQALHVPCEALRVPPAA